MKYLLILLLGICIGIGGEWLIPDKYTMNLTSGCYQSTKTMNIFMPEIYLYNKTWLSDPAPLLATTFNWRSYDILLEFLTKGVYKLNQTECTLLYELLFKTELKYYKQFMKE
mgnify:CR=1 FL=1